ncbi:MAG TPA: cytochrome c biogenesis protein CcdA [Gammaproteobacteria bacterium]|nr:cytochrome c biogenesis protein CcdA [Gammaproteobacteria bacterium]
MNDISIFAALVAGIVSFLSPCVLPLVPGYLSYISGVSQQDFAVAASAGGEAVADRAALLRGVTVNAIFFVLGFTTIFVALGASATSIGSFLFHSSAVFTRVAGVVIIVFGLHISGLLRIPFLYREKRYQTSERPRSLAGAYGIGMAFAFGWTPCIGPILGSVLAMAATRSTVTEGIGLLTVYSLGLGLPFIAAALGFNYLISFITRFRRFFRGVEIVAGVLLIAIGVLVLTGRMTWLSQQLSFLNAFVL